MKVRLSPQVIDFVRALAPEPRRRLRAALRDLAKGKGDVRPREGPLQDYCRLRLGSYRVIFRHEKPQLVECIFAEHRSIIYEVFADVLIERLMRNT